MSADTKPARRAFDWCLSRAALIYRSMPIPASLRQRINLLLLGRLYFLTRHVLRALDAPPDESLGLTRALARLAEATAAGPTATAGFPVVNQPEVSIIIPVFNHVDYTRLCLASIAESATRRSFEVIVVDDASTDATPALLDGRNDLQVLRNERNVGFIRSCQRGARAARGRLLLFLNNDTWVVPGWLDALADTLDGTPGAGLVGSKLVYPDGRLQEAGGIIWNDASGWNYGRMQDPQRPEFNYLRDVDYCSGASIMIGKSLFNRLGGFDERYVPAYFEDTDLAFTVRAAGLRVLYQPVSEVIHFEGVTSGRDLKQGVKAYQVANLAKFRDKWSAVLAKHRPPGEMPHLEKERTVERRALVIDVRTPMPDRDSGSIDAFNYFRILIELGFKVSFVASECPFHAGRYTQALQQIGVECLYEPYLTNLTAHFRERGGEYDLVMLNRAHNAAHYIDRVRRHCPNARVIFNTVDLHFLRERRHAELVGSAAMLREAECTREKELRTMRAADATIVLSHAERELLERELPDVTLFTIPLLREIPGRSAAFAARRDILFIGGYEHPPNVDAVIHFARETWPLIRQQMPEATFFMLGSNAPEEVRALAGNGIVCVGYVDDLSPWFGRCRLSVAPLRYGAGIKGKIATSLGFGLPCVATGVAIEGMSLVDGQEVIVADDPQQFADAVIRVHSDEDLWQGLSDNGLAFVEKHFSLSTCRELIREMLDQLLARPARERNALVPRRPRLTSTETHLAVAMADSFGECRQREPRLQDEYVRRASLEASLVRGRRTFTLRGYCYTCGGRRHFVVDFKSATAGAAAPNWRESMMCWQCRLNNRNRAALQIFEEIVRPGIDDAIYVTEQCTPLYRWLARRYQRVTGSEYLADKIAAGTVDDQGIRNESITRLSFADATFDHILSFDVLEHVPDYRVALAECLRCLKPGGSFLFSRDLAEHLERARLHDDGSIEHILPAEYHGDPMNAAGCLCFRHFGWNLLDDMRGAGFARATACIYWSKELGYLGVEQIIFLGIKAHPDA